MQLLRVPLRVAVRTALRTAMRDNVAVTRAMPASSETDNRQVEITAAPLIHSKAPDYYASASPSSTTGAPAQDPTIVVRETGPGEVAAGEERAHVAAELQSATEAYEATNEELKAATKKPPR